MSLAWLRRLVDFCCAHLKRVNIQLNLFHISYCSSINGQTLISFYNRGDVITINVQILAFGMSVNSLLSK